MEIPNYMYANGNHQARIELPVSTRHRRNMTGKLLKPASNQNTHISFQQQWSRMYKDGNHQAALSKVPP